MWCSFYHKSNIPIFRIQCAVDWLTMWQRVRCGTPKWGQPRIRGSCTVSKPLSEMGLSITAHMKAINWTGCYCSLPLIAYREECVQCWWCNTSIWLIFWKMAIRYMQTHTNVVGVINRGKDLITDPNPITGSEGQSRLLGFALLFKIEQIWVVPLGLQWLSLE